MIPVREWERSPRGVRVRRGQDDFSDHTNFLVPDPGPDGPCVLGETPVVQVL